MLSDAQGRAHIRRRRLRAAVTTAALGSFIALASVPVASAAFTPPPLPPADHPLTVFPDRDMVVLDGYNEKNTPFDIYVFRGDGVQIGKASGTTDDDGVLEVNHPGGECWQDFTPNIMGGDVVVVTPKGAPVADGEAMTVQTLDAAPAEADALTGDVIVKGTAKSPDGSPLDLANVEQRIVNPDLKDAAGDRSLSAVLGGDPDGGELFADPNVPGGFIARFTQFTDSIDRLLIAGQTRVMAWQTTDAAGNRIGLTIAEVGEIGGPGISTCPARADYSVTQSSNTAVTKAMNDARTAVSFSGVSQDATSVSITLSDGDAATPDPVRTVTPAAAGSQTWTVTFTGDEIAALKDGALTAHGDYSVLKPDLTTAVISGTDKTIEKDTVAPGAPIATPGTGTYETTQVVTLDRPDPASVVHFTASGLEPSAASPVAPAELTITSTRTIKAIAVDPVGNTSTVSTFAYTISPKGANPTPAAGSVIPGLGQTGGSAVAGAAARPLAVSRLTLRSRVSVRRLRAKGLRIAMRVPKGTRSVRIAVHRVRNGKAQKATVVSQVGRPTKSGAYTVTLRPRTLRKLRRGTYVALVTPVGANGPGRTSRVAFTVTR
jgi:hypothetical protein